MAKNKDTDIYALELDIILSEASKDKKKTGRPRGVTLESYKAFWYWYLQTNMREWSADKAGISLNSFYSLRNGSQTFSKLLDLRGEDLKAVSMININRSVRGMEEKRDENGNLIAPAKAGDVEDSKWVISTLYKANTGNDPQAPSIGAPQNEKEAELLLWLMNNHADHVRKSGTESSK